MPFDIQKVLHLDKALAKKSFNFSRSDWALMPKLDGWYVYIDCLEGRWQQLSSSACREIPAFQDLTEKFSKIKPLAKSGRLIFEATIPDKSFSETNGIFNRKYEQAENVILNLHDLVFFDDFSKPFASRNIDINNFAYEAASSGVTEIKKIDVIEITNDLVRVKELFSELTSSGEEGIIAKKLTAGYSFGKRNDDLLKLKLEQSVDARILNWFWTKGDKGNHAMNLTLGLKNGLKFNVVVNRHSAVDTILTNPHIIGTIVEVSCMEFLETGMPRQAVFKDFRFNKVEND